MSKKDPDKIKPQKDLKSQAAADPVLDEPDNNQAAGPAEDAQKIPVADPLNTAAEGPDDSKDDQTVVEVPEEGTEVDQAAAEDAVDRQTAMDSQAVAATQRQTDNKDEELESEDPSDDEDSHPAPEADQNADEKDLDAETIDPNASLSTEPDDDLSADKESDSADETKESRSSQAASDDKGEDDQLTDANADDSSEPAAAKTSINDKKKSNDALDDSEGKDPSAPKPNDSEAQTEDLPDLEPRRRKSLVKAALTVIVLAAVFCGFFLFDNKPNIKSAKRPKAKESANAFSAKARPNKSKSTIQPDDPNYIYYAKIDEISSLRETLLHKKEEIIQLKKHYQAGIEELEKEILDELRHAATVSFIKAIKNKRIEFGLRTIQRRLAYIRQLDRPEDWVFQAAEDLLYIKRKALMDIEVAEVASGIDMNMHVRHMNTALNKYRPTADKLAIDATDAQSESLEAIWQRIQNKSLAHSSQLAHSKNQIISEQICTGDFNRLTELSEISADSAKCIVEMQGSDLFLNGLTEISPRAARQLFQWKGNWICLNGFRALSPRVAAYLFEWEGSWISLNGLTDFPPEMGRLLLQWGGSQLELMGLRYTDGSTGKIGIKYLAQWEHAGGKLFVPKTIRKKIDELNGSQRPRA